jgi:uncharacterized protein YodC (DUF2158 family)
MPVNAKFKNGTVVYLISGSPAMTATFTGSEGTVDVSWFHEGKPQHGSYNQDSLTDQPPTTPSPGVFA